MTKFVHVAAAALILAAVNPALAQLHGIPDIGPSPAPQFPGTTPYPTPAIQPSTVAPEPGPTESDQTGNETWRDNTWRRQQFDENWRNDNWQQQRANQNWQEREKFNQRRNDYNLGLAPETNEENAAKSGCPAVPPGVPSPCPGVPSDALVNAPTAAPPAAASPTPNAPSAPPATPAPSGGQ